MTALADAVGREPIDLSDGRLHVWADRAWAALVAANDLREPTVMVRGNELVRMTERGELEAHTVDSLRDELSRGGPVRPQRRGGWRPVAVPVDVARNLLARDSAKYAGAPRVDRVVDIPVAAADGSIITEPGYHAASRLFYRPAPGMETVTPEPVGMVDEVVHARDFLMTELLGDFAWADEASKANALGLLLLPFVRDLIDGPTPMHIIVAPSPGTGKTLLAEAALMPSCGEDELMADAGTDDEWRKRLTAVLLRGSRAVLFDDLRRPLDSGALAAALTSGTWSDRMLGVNKELSLPVRNAWVATGNNLSLTDEHARRAVAIFLDPGEQLPANRPKTAYPASRPQGLGEGQPRSARGRGSHARPALARRPRGAA